MGAEYRADGRGREGRDLSLNRFAHRMHSRFLEQRTISQGSIYAAPAASNRGRGGRGGEGGRRSAYPNSFTYFPLSRKYIRSFYLLSPSFPPSVSWLLAFFFSLFFFFSLAFRATTVSDTRLGFFRNCDFSFDFLSLFSFLEKESGENESYAIFWNLLIANIEFFYFSFFETVF